MTTTGTTVAAPDRTPSPARVLGLRVVAGLRDDLSARSLLAWMVARPSSPGDTYYLAHVYDQLRLDCAWDPVVGRREHLRRDAGLVVARALQYVRSRRPELGVSGAAVAGRPEDVLVEFSRVADLVVVGQDGTVGDAQVAVVTAQSARCPVLVVPFDWPSRGTGARGPITVLASPSLGLPTAAMRFGVQEALRYGTSVRVLVTDQPDPAPRAPLSAAALAGRQEQWDLVLEDWAAACPGVGIVAEVVTDDAPHPHPGTGRMTVVSRADPVWPELVSASGPPAPPVVVVPAG